MSIIRNRILLIGTLFCFFLPPVLAGITARLAFAEFRGPSHFWAAILCGPYMLLLLALAINPLFLAGGFLALFGVSIMFWRTQWGKAAAIAIAVLHCLVAISGGYACVQFASMKLP